MLTEMERIGEARRHNTVAGGGTPSRRRRGTDSLRDSPEDRSMETVRSRDRAKKMERDRDLFDRNKLRRVESVDGEAHNETEIRESHSNHNHRKSSRPSPPDSMAVDEIVGVAIPRKARSSSVKRSHEHLVAGNGSVSPATSNLSAGKKTKISRSCSVSQENIEIEVAEILYGLMKHSHSSQKESFAQNSPNYSNGVAETIRGAEQPTKRGTSLQDSINEKCEVSVQVAYVPMEIHKDVTEENSICVPIETGDGDGIESVETIVVTKDVSPLLPKLDHGRQYSTMAERKTPILGDENQQEEMNSNTKNGTIDMRLELNLGDPDRSLGEETSVSEVLAVEVEERKMKPIQENPKMLTIDLEQQDGENVPVLPSSSALTNNVPCWANRLLPLGYELTTVMTIDGNAGTSKSIQPPRCPLSQPRKRRCTTHHHIALNIYLHQRFVETDKKLGPALSCNLDLVLSANVDSVHGEGNAPSRSEEDKSLRHRNRKQLESQEASQPALVSNLQHSPALLFPISQNQAAAATVATQRGVSKSTVSINNPPSSSNSSPRAPPATAPPPTSFTYLNVATNETSLLPIFPNNGYPIPQAMPLFSGSFYSPQMFHPASTGSPPPEKKLQTQQPRGGVQSNRSNALASTGTMHIKQKQAEKQKGSNGGAELIPQSFTVSFASNGSNISFSSTAYNPGHLQIHPQAAKQGQTAQERHYQTPQGKNNGKESKAASGKPQTLLFDGSAGTLNFMSPPATGNWPNQIYFAASVPESPPRDGNGNQNSRTASTTALSRQTDNAATRTTTTTQKSSPVCGRYAPSILTTARPRHLPELKLKH